MKRRLWIALFVLAADQGSKALAVRFLKGIEGIALFPGVLGLRYTENTGAAFSMFSESGWLLALLSAATLAGVTLLLRRYRLGLASGTATMLMLGGAASNLLDRILRGYVIDMVEILAFRFAVFNAADIALTVGALLLGITFLRMPEEWSEKDHGDTAGNTP